MLIRGKTIFRSQKGFLTLQFMMGFVLVAFFMMLFAALSLTLAVSEMVQYMTFSASRALFLGHGTLEKQESQAREKYRALKTSPGFGAFFQERLGWFVITDDLQRDQSMGLNTHFAVEDGSPHLFFGVWTPFQARMLALENPFFGTTTEDTQTAFQTRIGSYLGREPSVRECESFNSKRWEALSRLHGWPPSVSLPQGADPQGSYRQAWDRLKGDNGC